MPLAVSLQIITVAAWVALLSMPPTLEFHRQIALVRECV